MPIINDTLRAAIAIDTAADSYQTLFNCFLLVRLLHQIFDIVIIMMIKWLPEVRGTGGDGEELGEGGQRCRVLRL